jgi:hypothetical protein
MMPYMSKRSGEPDAEGDPGAGDVAMVLDRIEGHDAYRVLRKRRPDSDVELGTLRPLKEGRPIDGEVVSMRARQDLPFVYDVKTELEDPHGDRRATSDGPPQVATEQYRRGWEAIWGTGADGDSPKPN